MSLQWHIGQQISALRRYFIIVLACVTIFLLLAVHTTKPFRRGRYQKEPNQLGQCHA
jgi:hypothetical protein